MSEVNKAVTKEQAKSLYDNLRGQLEATKENSIFIKPSEITNPATVSSNAASVINAAITKANANGMHFVVVPAGEYWLTETIYLKSDVILKGCGMDATTLKIADNCDIDAIRVAAPTNNSGIMDLSIDGNRIQNYSTFVNGHHGNAINVWLHYGRIERVRTNWVYKHSLLLNYDTGTGDDGLGFEPEHQNDMGNLNKVLWCDFRDSLLQGVMWGWRTMDSWMCYTNIGSHAANLYLEGGTSRFIGNHFDGDGDNGAGPEYNVYCGDGCRAMVFEDNIFENTQKENIFFRQPSYSNQTMTITIANNIIRTCSKSQNEQYANIKISGYSSSVPATEIVISGNQILNPDTNANHGYAGIHLLYCENSKIVGNTFFNVGDDEVLLDNTCENVLNDSKMSEEVHSLKTEINSKADKTVTDALQTDKAPVIIDHAEGNPIVLTDGAEGLPVEGMKIHFLPVQDLHGYDSPWPAGGGKNLLPTVLDTIKTINTNGTWSGNIYTHNGITYTVNIDNDGNITGVTANGTASGDSEFYIFSQYVFQTGSYVLNGCPSGGSTNTYRIFATNFGSDTGSGLPFTTDGTIKTTIRIQIKSGTQVSNQVYKPMVRLSSVSDATFAPYSNICPISGWTDLAMWRAGKNLLNPVVEKLIPFEDASFNRYSLNNGVITTTGNALAGFVILVKPSTRYTFSFTKQGSANLEVFAYAEIPDKIRNNDRMIAYQNQSSVDSFTIPSDCNYIVCAFVSTISSNVISEFQLELGGAASPYAEYTGESYPVTFPDGQTIYGGTIDPINGVLTVDMAYHVLLSTSLLNYDSGYSTNVSAAGGKSVVWFKNVFSTLGVKSRRPGGIKAYCNAFPIIFNSTNVNASQNRCAFIVDGVTINSVASFIDAIETMENNGENLYIAYELATPIEIPIDPITIQTLLGDNTIWSDANGTIELDYRADTKLFIAKQKTDIRATIAPIEDGTTASQAYSAGKFFYHDGNFCKAKTSIASGATFTLNTNYEITTVADELFALN